MLLLIKFLGLLEVVPIIFLFILHRKKLSFGEERDFIMIDTKNKGTGYKTQRHALQMRRVR